MGSCDGVLLGGSRALGWAGRVSAWFTPVWGRPGGKPYLNLGLRWCVLVVGLRVVAAKLPDDLYRALVERARREDASVSELVREAVRAHLGLPPRGRGDAVLEELRRRVAALEERVSNLEAAVAGMQPGLETGRRGEGGR